MAQAALFVSPLPPRNDLNERAVGSTVRAHLYALRMNSSRSVDASHIGSNPSSVNSLM